MLVGVVCYGAVTTATLHTGAFEKNILMTSCFSAGNISENIVSLPQSRSAASGVITGVGEVVSHTKVLLKKKGKKLYGC